MNVYISIKNGTIVEITGLPNKCPYCHNTIVPIALFGSIRGLYFDVFFKCPHQKCNSAFIGFYRDTRRGGGEFLFTGNTSQGNIEEKEFNETISKISPDFVNIYNEAYQAEQQDLLEICGVGYRKALEFLIKDYILHNNPDEREKVEKKQLGPCITEYVDDSRIKSVASRAVWLGNDETHYVRRWAGKNLKDLKILIDLTVHWIEMEALTKSVVDDMPEK